MAKLIKKEEVSIVWSDDPNFKKPSSKKQQIKINPVDYELHLRLEKKGRGGKTVTVIYNFPRGAEDYFKKLTKKIKKECGSGGTYKVDSIEVQGDFKEILRYYLMNLGFKVKFTGA